MVTIDIGCVLVNELSRLQIFTCKDKNMLQSLKFPIFFLELNLSLSIARHMSV